MFLTIQAAAREMIKRDIKGSIAITASMSGSVSNKGEQFLHAAAGFPRSGSLRGLT